MMGKRGNNGGVGRGCGEGSRRTQFSRGGPSGNPAGRPRKRKEPPLSIAETITRILAEPIQTTENGIERWRSRAEAMLLLLVNNFSKVNVREQIALLKFLQSNAPLGGEQPQHVPRAEAIAAVLQRLSEEADREEENTKALDRWR